jgi:hypothetical protein
MKREALFWTRRLRPQLRREAEAAGVSLAMERVENVVANGTPDANYCAAGVSGHIELKYAPKDPTRPTTPVLGKGNGMRRSQVVWAVRNIRAGARVYACIGTPTRVWLIDLRPLDARQMYGLELLPAPVLDELAAWHNHHRAPLLSTLMAFE